MQQVSNCCLLRPVLMQTSRILSVPKQTKPKFIWVQMQTPLFSADFFFLNNPCTSPPLVGTGLRQAAGLTVREGLGSATRAGSLWATCLSWRGLVGVIDVWIIPGLSWRDNMGGILCEARAAVLCDGGCLCLALRINSPVCWRENCVAMCRREFNFFCCCCCWLSVNRCLRHSDINEEFLPPHTALRLPAESCRPRVF